MKVLKFLLCRWPWFFVLAYVILVSRTIHRFANLPTNLPFVHQNFTDMLVMWDGWVLL